MPQHVQSPPLLMADRIKSSPDTLAREGFGVAEQSHSPFVDNGSHERPPSNAYDNQQPCTSSQAQVSPLSMSSFHLQEVKKTVGFIRILFQLEISLSISIPNEW